MQSHLDNAAISLSHVKSIFQHTVVPSCDGEVDDRETYDLIRKTDLFIMQSRSAKVIAGKAIRQLEDLKTRSLALEPSTLPSIERTQDCVSDIANLAREIGMSLVKLVNEEGQNSPITYEEILRQVSTSDAQLFSSLSSKLNSTASQMQTFYNLTSSLSQTIEFPSPPAPSPWLLLAQKLKDEATNLAVNKSEVGRLKDEIAEKNTAMAFREKLAEELTVKVEVLEKRVGESGGRREKVRELEGIIDIARAKEQDLLRHYKRLQQSVHELESERESWQKSAQSPIATAPNGSPLDPQNSSYSSPAAAQKIASLESEIVSLQSAVRYLRSASQSHTLASSLSFLSTPLLPPKPAPPTSLQSEAADVFKELLHIVTRPENQLVKLHAVKREDRLRWKPMRETTAWKVGKQKEEWERWKEWKTEVVKKAESARKEERRKREIRAKRGDQQEHQHQPVIAEIQGKLGRGQKWPGGEIKITKSADWDEVERTWGLP